MRRLLTVLLATLFLFIGLVGATFAAHRTGSTPAVTATLPAPPGPVPLTVAVATVLTLLIILRTLRRPPGTHRTIRLPRNRWEVVAPLAPPEPS